MKTAVESRRSKVERPPGSPGSRGALALAALLALGTACASTQRPPTARFGERPNLEGATGEEPIRRILQPVEGAAVVVVFFATWAEGAEQLLPELHALAARSAAVVALRGVAIDEDQRFVGGFLDRLKTPMTVVSDPGGAASTSALGVRRVPSVLVLAPDGHVAGAFEGAGAQTLRGVRGAIDRALSSIPAPAPEAVPAAPAPTSSWNVPALHSAGLLLGMRLSAWALWPDAYDPFAVRRNLRQFGEAYTKPPDYRAERALFESDGDPWPLNAVGHALFGSEVYGRSRRCGHGFAASLAATTATSVVWEYGVEAFHKRPSAIDLAWTPVAGVLLGEARFRLQRLLGRGEPGLARRALLLLVDPFGEAERRLLGTAC